jgi:hypothetical protein
MKFRIMAGFVLLAAGAGVVVGLSGGGEPTAAVTAEADSIKVIDGECPSSTVARLEKQIDVIQKDREAIVDSMDEPFKRARDLRAKYYDTEVKKEGEPGAPIQTPKPGANLAEYDALAAPIQAEIDALFARLGPLEFQQEQLRAQIRVILEAAKCKGSYEKDGMCFCITDTKDPDGEVKEKDAPRGKVKRLWVCPGKEKAPPSVRWDSDADTPPPGCTIAAKALTDTSMGSYDSDLVEQLRAFCSPCPVTGDSWSVCPRCGIGEPGKTDCKALCPAPAEPK